MGFDSFFLFFFFANTEMQQKKKRQNNQSSGANLSIDAGYEAECGKLPIYYTRSISHEG